MSGYFSTEFFEGNRAKLRSLFRGTAPIVLTANGLSQRSGDTAYPFQQDSSFWYLTGINDPNIILVLDKDKEYFILPEQDRVQEIFDGSIETDDITKTSGIKTVLDNKTGWKQLTVRLKRVKHIATLAATPDFIPRLGMYTNPARAALIEKLKAVAPTAELLDLSPHLTRQRMVKQPEELTALQTAINITTATLKDVSKKLGKYNYEYEVEADITAGFRKRGADGHGYQPIVASDNNACTLHYMANNASLDDKKLLLMDVGAEVEHYSADITRTYTLGKPSKRIRTVHEAVNDIQNYALNQLKPGVLIKDYEQKVEHYIGEKLRELGLIKSITPETVRRYAPHSTSHFLGLDVHDVADYDRPLETNMVLTVEPGIYIPEENIGIRIEDDVLITPKGAKILSHTSRTSQPAHQLS